MGFMDKAKEAAAQASQIAQQGMAQGQAHLDEVQGKQNANALMRTLGEAFYAEQRQGGPHEAVVEALQALDQHLQARAAEPPTGTNGPDPAPPTPPGRSGPSGTTPGGNFTLDDL